MSQSFGKSFPDISEDGEDVPDGREEEEGDLMRLSSSFTGPSSDHSLGTSPSLAPAKPRRTMVTSYSNINLPATPETRRQVTCSSVRSRVKMFESMTTDGKSARSLREAKSVSDDKAKVETAPTPTPAPMMSISSSSSATSCGYKDFLIDDDYIDQQQLIISSNRETVRETVNTGSSLENTLKEKVNKFLANEKENDNNFEKSDDDNSVRELFVSKEAPGSSMDTLSEQESLSSEAGELERVDTEDITGESEDCGVFEIPDINHDVLQDVMDVNTLLLKLQTILMEVST